MSNARPDIVDGCAGLPVLHSAEAPGRHGSGTTRRELLAATLAAGLVAACGGAGSETPEDDELGRAVDYWSADAASHWVFDGRDNVDGGAAYRQRTTIGAPLQRFARTLVRFQHSRPFNNPFGATWEYRTHDPVDGIRTFLDTDPTSLARSYVELPPQIEPGTYRAYEGSEPDGSGTRSVRIDVTIVGLEDLALPAGRVGGALKTVLRVTITRTIGAPTTQVTTLTRWYARRLGIVRQVLDDPGVMPQVNSYVEELAGVIVPGTQAGVVGDFTLLDALAPAGSMLASGRPGIAGDGSGFLVVARALDAAGDGRIVATYVDAGGHARWRRTVIDALGRGVLEYGPVAVAYDGAAFWIAARSEDTVAAGTVLQRVTTEGELLEAPAGRAVGGEWPSLASNGQSVLLTTSRNLGAPSWAWARFATLFRRDGSVLRAEQRLAVGAQTGAPTARGEQYLVCLDSEDVRAVRIDAAGNLLDGTGPIDVSTAPSNQGHSVVAPRGDGYVALWLDARRYGDQPVPVADVYGARIAADGRLLDGPAHSGGVALNVAHSERHGLALAGGARGTLAVWTLGTFVAGPVQPAGLFARYFAPGAAFGVTDPSAKGTLLHPLTAQDPNVRLMAPAAAASAEGFAVVWVRQDRNAGGVQSVRGALVYPPLTGT